MQATPECDTTESAMMQSNSEAATPTMELIVSEPHSPYQPVVEPINPVQSDPNREVNTATGETFSAQSVDDLFTTTPPGSPPLSPSHDDDDIDTEEYEDSIMDNNAINGDNILLNNDLNDNITGCNTEQTNDATTTYVNVGNIPPQCVMSGGNETLNTNVDTNGDNKTLNTDVDTNRDVTNGHNKEIVVNQNGDTSGHNILDSAPTLKHDVNMNSHNKGESTHSNLTENRDDISSSPPPSNVSDVPHESPINDPHREIRVYGTVKVHNQVLDLWLYEAETRKSYVSVPKMSDEDIQRWINPESVKPSWQDLDPYSSLEEIISNDNNNNQSDTENQGHNIRERKPKNINSHPHRNRKEINYNGLCDDNTDPASSKFPR